MNRHVKTALVLALLVVFPVISYIYLKRGFEYQKDNFAELENRIKVSPDEALAFPYDSCLGKVNMVIFLSDDQAFTENYRLIRGLEDQYTKIPKYAGVVYALDELKAPDAPLKKLEWIQVSQDQWSLLKEGFPYEDFAFNDGEALILDVENKIRNSYDMTDPAGLKKMIAHASLLFPKQKRKR